MYICQIRTKNCLNLTANTCSGVLAWLGLKATGFGLALSGLGLPYLQAKPTRLALAWLWLGLAQAMAWKCKINHKVPGYQWNKVVCGKVDWAVWYTHVQKMQIINKIYTITSLQ